jgi:predicted Zn-dependent protease with MMP-like domain
MTSTRDYDSMSTEELDELAKELAARTPDECLRLADELYAQVARTHPERLKRPQTMEELLASEDFQTHLRLRRIFDAHAAKVTAADQARKQG